MNKKYLLLIIPIIGLSLFLFFGFSNKSTEGKIVKNENTLAIMLETEAGTQNYSRASSDAYPTDGYLYNAERSYCDKGGTITWNDQTGTAIIKSRYPEKCYVYFDLIPGYISCSAGTYLAANSITCSTCPGGSYCAGGAFEYDGTAKGIIDCSTLGTGYTSDAGASTNTGCYITVSAGSYKSSLAGTTTTGCGAGKYSTQHKGYYNVADNACSNIEAGCYGTSATTSCPAQCVASTITTAGTYSSAGQASCTTATSGNYVATAKASAQTTCPAGLYCTDGKRANCSSLGTGYTSNSGAAANTDCFLNVSAGYYKTSANGVSTSTCTAGSYRAAHTSNYGSTDYCTTCSSGTTSSTGSSTCSACSNATGVQSWNQPSAWTANTVNNVCSINACQSNYDLSSNQCLAVSSYAYWSYSQGGNGTQYSSGSKPSTTYSSYTNLGLSQPASYMRTSIYSGSTVGNHFPCLYYNNKTFCFTSTSQWQGTVNVTSTDAGTATANHLRSLMTTAFGSTPTCESNASAAVCYYSASAYCSISFDNRVSCGNRSSCTYGLTIDNICTIGNKACTSASGTSAYCQNK